MGHIMFEFLAHPATALGYLSAAFAIVFLWPTLRLRIQSGVNALVLARGESAEAVVSRWFKGTMAALFVMLVLATLAPTPWDQPGSISLPWPTLRLVVGWIILGVALAAVAIAQAQMGSSWRIGIDRQTTSLREAGLFALSRNPIFLGMRLMMLGLFIVLPNAMSLAILLLGEVLIQIQVRFEEAHLERMHGQAYREYRSRVPRWL